MTKSKETNTQKEKKVYRSLIEVERKFLPESYEGRRRDEKLRQDVGDRGTGIVTGLISNLRANIAK